MAAEPSRAAPKARDAMPSKDFIDFAFDLLGEEGMSSLDDPTLEAVTRAAAGSSGGAAEDGPVSAANPSRPRPAKRQLVDADDDDGDEDEDEDEDDEDEDDEDGNDDEAGPSSRPSSASKARGARGSKAKGASGGVGRPRKSVRAAANKATREKARRDRINDR
jgi:hypothetical protein